MSQDFRHVMGAFYGTPWAILPDKLREIQAVIDARLRDGRGHTPPSAFDGDDPPRRRSRDEAYRVLNGVAVIPLMGTVTQRPSVFAEFSGGCSAEVVGRAVEQAAADRDVTGILLDVDSPGGSVYGVPECASKIREARGKKRIIAVANSMIASAAYWLAAQASEVWCTPSGEVGCIGVIGTFVDHSKADEKAGYKYTHIHAGRYKAEMYGTAPLSEDTREYLQGQVDAFYRKFVDALAGGRRTSAKLVDENYGQGRMMMADDALRAGMIDRVGTAEQALAELARSKGQPVRTSPSAHRPPATLSADAARRRRQIAARMTELGLPTDVSGNG